jgi:uncharacterized protein YbjT (DUF2867 family)
VALDHGQAVVHGQIDLGAQPVPEPTQPQRLHILDTGTMAGRRVWPLPANLDMQPCDTADFASYVIACLNDGPRGVRQDYGGPKIRSVVEFARQYQAIRDIRRRILPLHMPARMLRAAGRQTCPDGRRGATTWSDWLARTRPARVC